MNSGLIFLEKINKNLKIKMFKKNKLKIKS